MVLTYQQITVNQTNLQNVVCENIGIIYLAKWVKKVMSRSWWGGISNSIYMCIMSPTTKSRSGFPASSQCSNTESSPRADHIWTPPLQLVSHLHSHVGLPIKEVCPHNFIHICTSFGAANSCTLQSVDRLWIHLTGTRVLSMRSRCRTPVWSTYLSLRARS